MAFRPLISIIGATGTGKSQLAVELAKRFNGEIINADAMQMYRGLDVITNKHPIAEREGIPHHLMDYVPTTEDINTLNFEESAIKTISEIRSRGKLPIVVGGTHYYIQRLLLPTTLHEPPEHPTSEQVVVDHPILNASTPELLAKLTEIDPQIAARWHPNDRRKIRRSLEIFFQTGKTPSQIYAQQRQEAQQDTASRRIEFNNLVFWTHAERDILRKRLDDRVDKMIEGGLFSEIDQLWIVYCSMGGKKDEGGNVDIEKGIWQTIGFKEFLPYLKASPTEKTKELRDECVEKMKSATRNYAKTQEKWIRTKLMHAISGSDILLYLLDTTDIAAYSRTAVNPAIEISKLFLDGTDPQQKYDPKALSALAESCLVPRTEYDLSQTPDAWVKRTCESCNTTTVGDFQWEKHVQSTRHKKTVARLKKREEVRVFLEKRAAAEAASAKTKEEEGEADSPSINK